MITNRVPGEARTNLLLPYDYDGTKRQKQRKRLSDAAHFYGIEGWQGIDKEDIAKAIGDGVWREKYSPQDVIDYCTEDTLKEAQLLRRQLLDPRCPDVDHVCYWSDYSA